MVLPRLSKTVEPPREYDAGLRRRSRPMPPHSQSIVTPGGPASGALVATQHCTLCARASQFHSSEFPAGQAKAKGLKWKNRKAGLFGGHAPSARKIVVRAHGYCHHAPPLKGNR